MCGVGSGRIPRVFGDTLVNARGEFNTSYPGPAHFSDNKSEFPNLPTARGLVGKPAKRAALVHNTLDVDFAQVSPDLEF